MIARPIARPIARRWTLPRRRATWRHPTAHGGMFDSFRKFLSEVSEGGEHPIRFEHNDYRLAAAALLVHAAAVGDVSDAERDQLHAVIKRQFDLGAATTGAVVAEATGD